MNLVALVSLARMAPAQDTISTSNQSIQGTWIAQVADATGNISLFEVGTFSADGGYSGANVNPTHTTHKGVWLRTGDRKFVMTVMFFTHDDKGVFNGIVKARIFLTLAEDQKSFDSVAERVVMDASGKVLQVTPGIVGHSVPGWTWSCRQTRRRSERLHDSDGGAGALVIWRSARTRRALPNMFAR